MSACAPVIWTPHEDEALRSLLLVSRLTNWDRIAARIPGKTSSQCKERWQHVRPPSPDEITERRHWTKDEDDRLRTLVARYGERNWRLVASYLQDRLPKQCRERWINHLQDGISKGKFTEEEWAVIVQAQKELGNKWSDIALLLPGRSPNQIKNFWHTTMRKQRASTNKRVIPRKRKTESEEEVDASSEYMDETALGANPTHSDEDYRPIKRPRRNSMSPPSDSLIASGPIAMSAGSSTPTSGSFSVSATDTKNLSTSDDELENGLDVLSQMAEVHYNLLLSPEYKDKVNVHPLRQLHGAPYVHHPMQSYGHPYFPGVGLPPYAYPPHLMPALKQPSDFVMPPLNGDLAPQYSSFSATSTLYPGNFVGSSPQQLSSSDFGVTSASAPNSSIPPFGFQSLPMLPSMNVSAPKKL